MSCQPCTPGKFKDTVGFSVLTQNSPPVYEYRDTTSCTDCLAATYSEVVASTHCWDCDAGKYSAAVGMSACLECQAGKYSATVRADTEQTCLKCPVNTYSNGSASTTCTLCAEGYQTFSEGFVSCVLIECNAGYVGPGYQGYLPVAPCVGCPAGKFKTVRGSTECIECEAGKYSSILNAASASVCLQCNAGKFSTSASDRCTQCNAGKWQSATASSTCFLCAEGLSNEPGAVDQASCVCGRGLITENGVCQSCPQNTFKSIMANGMKAGYPGWRDTCQQCPIWTASPHGSFQWSVSEAQTSASMRHC